MAKRTRTLIDIATRKKKTRGIGRPTNKGSIGKEVLIEKTAQLLRTLPPEKLSLTAAAQAANVHLTLLKYYFQDRTRLLTEVARHLTLKLGKKVEAAEDDRPPPPERLRIRIDAMVDFYFENPFYHRLMVEIMAETEDPLAAELINVWMSRTLDDLSRHHGRRRRTRFAARARCVVHVSGDDGAVRAVSLQPASLCRPRRPSPLTRPNATRRSCTTSCSMASEPGRRTREWARSSGLLKKPEPD